MRLSLLAFFLFALHLEAQNLIQYNIYPRTDRVDIMLSFDAPFTGQISQHRGEGYTAITLGGVDFPEKLEKPLDTDYLRALTMYSDRMGTHIILLTESQVQITASKTPNDYGLRFRLKAEAPPPATPPKQTTQTTKTSAANEVLSKMNAASSSSIKQDTPQAESTPNDLQQSLKQETIDPMNFIYISLVLGGLIIVLLSIKKKVNPKQSGWLFGSSVLKSSDGEFKIVAQKQLDIKNRVILLETQGFRYLIIIGASGSFVVDKFPTDSHSHTVSAHSRDDEFETLLEQNHKQLDHYLELDNHHFESYKQKASG